jgi:hypothetical protein
MADLVISGNTSGSVTLRAPNVSGSTVLTLDTTSGTLASPIGVGQTWENVTLSRTKGTTYTNSTGKPILIAVSLNETFPSSWSITINGSVVISSSHSGSSYNGWSGAVIVPNEATYSATGAGTLKSWWELR